MKKALIFVILIFCLFEVHAQRVPSERVDDGLDGNSFNSMRDTTKVIGGLKNGKLLDDSTKQIYGPTTSKYTYYKDIKESTHRYLTIDTVLDNVHRFNYVNQWDNKLQDLGNIGTPSMPTYYQLPSLIGVTSGYTIFDPYQKTIDDIRFYNTKSPFSDIQYHNGGRGRGITDVAYSRNINERWNVGLDFKGLFIDKQIERKGKGDRHVTNTSYDLYMHYTSKDDKYYGLVTFVRNMHRAVEFGGLKVDVDTIQSNYFEDNVQLILSDAVSRELTRDYLLYQEYKFSKLVGVYYDLERNLRRNDFYDKLTDVEIDTFYDTTRVNATETQDRNYFDAIKNEIGVKGNVSKAFYNLYYKHRTYKANYFYLDDYVSDVEEYGGFNLRYDFDSTFNVGGSMEYMVEGAHKFNGYINHRFVNASYTDMEFRPSMKNRFFYGNHAYWSHQFTNTQAREIKANVNFRWKSQLIQPKIQLTNLNNLIYYDTLGKPKQSGQINKLSFGADMHLIFFNKMHFKNELLITKVDGPSADVMRVPDLLANVQLYYQNMLFNGNLEVQAGVDGTWKSAYYANAYQPSIQEFYLQNDFELPSFPLVDIFVNIKINRGIAYFKYINVAQAIGNIGDGPASGYFTTPRFSGQRNGIDFGVKWAFYD